jgi:hypothetical protein
MLNMESPHHESTKSLLMSAAWGCGICTRLEKRLSTGRFPTEYSRTINDHSWLKYDFEFNPYSDKAVLFIAQWSDITSILDSFEGGPLEMEQVTDQSSLHNIPDTGDEEVSKQPVHGFHTVYHTMSHVRSMPS